MKEETKQRTIEMLKQGYPFELIIDLLDSAIEEEIVEASKKGFGLGAESEKVVAEENLIKPLRKEIEDWKETSKQAQEIIDSLRSEEHLSVEDTRLIYAQLETMKAEVKKIKTILHQNYYTYLDNEKAWMKERDELERKCREQQTQIDILTTFSANDSRHKIYEQLTREKREKEFWKERCIDEFCIRYDVSNSSPLATKYKTEMEAELKKLEEENKR